MTLSSGFPRLAPKGTTYPSLIETDMEPHHTWEGYEGVSGRAESNCRPPGPKPGALPLGHAPVAGKVGFKAMSRGTEDSFSDWPHCLSVWGTEVRQLIKLCWYPRGDSNSRFWLRRPALYPLSYGGLH